MRYVVGFMAVAFFLAGAGLFAAGVYGLIRRFAARRRLRPAEGEIIYLDIRQTTTDSDSGGRTSEYHYPEIRFRDARGIEQTFLSEIGAGSLSSDTPSARRSAYSTTLKARCCRSSTRGRACGARTWFALSPARSSSSVRC